MLPILDLVLSFAMTVLLFAMIYKYVPRETIAWRDVWIGAAVTAFLFAIGKSLIGLYLGRSSFSGAYGAAGSLVVLLMWVYYSAQIFLLGAEFTRVFAYSRGSRVPSLAGSAECRCPLSSTRSSGIAIRRRWSDRTARSIGCAFRGLIPAPALRRCWADRSMAAGASARSGKITAVRRRYRDGTLILETEFETAEGRVRLTDFMPASRDAVRRGADRRRRERPGRA